VASATDCGVILREAAVLRATVLYLPTAHVTKNQLLYYYTRVYKSPAGYTHTQARGVLLKNQRAIVLDGKTNLHNIFVHARAR